MEFDELVTALQFVPVTFRSKHLTFRVKIITPLFASEADLQRRQRRYLERVGSETKVKVVNLLEGPATLDRPNDMQRSNEAVYQEAMKTSRAEFDAIILDCVFEPAIDALRLECPIPTFGPIGLTLPIVSMVSSKFCFICRAGEHKHTLIDIVTKYGYEQKLVHTVTLNISYEESRDPECFENALIENLLQIKETGNSEAVVLGSTTWEISDRVRAAVEGLSLFMPGMIAINALEYLWEEGFISHLKK